MIFKIEGAQLDMLKDWHNDCDAYAGAIGGRISYIFTPTGLGTCIVVRCMCGEELNLTDVTDW